MYNLNLSRCLAPELWGKGKYTKQDILYHLDCALNSKVVMNKNMVWWEKMQGKSIMEKRKNSENILLRNSIPKIFYFMKSPCKKNCGNHEWCEPNI